MNDYNRLQCPNIHSIEEYADMYFVYENIAERLLLLSEGMLMLVLGRTEDVLNIYYDFFQYKYK
jgi:hypothetical protein